MAYTKTVWTDELPATTPIKYLVTDDTDGVVAESATIEVLTSVTAGTPVNAANLNHIETGIYNAQVAADAASTAAGTALSTAEAAQVTASAAQATADEALSAVTDPAALLPFVYPVGSIYMSVVSTSPAVLFNFGNWEALGAGRVLVGAGTSDAIYAAGATGGASAVTLTTLQIASHSHIQDPHNHTDSGHNHTQNSHTHAQDAHNHSQNAHDHPTGASSIERSYPSGVRNDMLLGAGNMSGATGSTIATNVAATATNQAATASNNSAAAAIANNTATNQSAGGGEAHDNMPPYLVVYMWKRIAD